MKRPAFTLIELVLTMTVGSSLMVLSIGLLQQSMRLATLARHRAETHRALDRLASEFRHDLHRAVQCSIEQPNRIDLVMGDSTEVSYIAQSNVVTREQGGGGEAQDASQPLRRESYDLGEGGSATFEKSDRADLASMTISTASVAGPPRTDRHVTAAVGRLTRLESTEASP